MPEPRDSDAREFDSDELALRRRSDQIVETIARLANLEVDKREAEPGTAGFVATAGLVRQLAQALLDLAIDEERLAERLEVLRGQSRGALPERSIAEVPGARSLDVVLAEWREAERRLLEADVDSDARRAAEADAVRLREEYQRTVPGSDKTGI
jgi:hypothetical protein